MFSQGDVIGLAGIGWALLIQAIGMGTVFMVILFRDLKAKRIEIRVSRQSSSEKVDE